MRVLVFGDSISQGFWDTEGGWVARLIKHYDSLSLKDLHQRDFTTVFNLGVSGDTTRNLIARVGPETKAREWPGEDQVVLVAIGTNDDLFEKGEQFVPPEEFRQNLQRLVSTLRPTVKNIMFIGNAACDEKMTTPVFWADVHYTNEQVQKYNQIVFEVAKEHGLPFVPIFEEFKKHLDAGEDLLADGLHPNDEGHKLIYELVLPELDKLLR